MNTYKNSYRLNKDKYYLESIISLESYERRYYYYRIRISNSTELD